MIRQAATRAGQLSDTWIAPVNSDALRNIESLTHLILGLCLFTAMPIVHFPGQSALLAVLALLVVYRGMASHYIEQHIHLSPCSQKDDCFPDSVGLKTQADAAHGATVLGGKYRLDAEIAQGAIAQVFLGKNLCDDQIVAIKTLNLDSDELKHGIDPVAKLFQSEAETAGRLRHKNIVEIFDSGKHYETAYIVMELIKGQNLKPYTKKHSLLPVSEVLQIIITCARALAHAHEQNIVHRDIKPANIMYDRGTGEIKLTDFGIAHFTDSGVSESGLVMGTPLYMSPEQISGKKIDGRSDLFSLGGMLLHLLIGQPPFPAKSLPELMGKIAKDNPLILPCSHPQISGRLNALITRALRKDITLRYQTGHQMADDLQECLETLAESELTT